MEKNLTNIKERVLVFCKFKGLSIEPFLESIGMTYGSFKGKAKKGSLNSDAIANIYTKFPELNLEWLLTGYGEMLKKNHENNLNTLKTPFKDNLNTDINLLVESLKETIESQKTTIKSLQLAINYLHEKNNNPIHLDFNIKNPVFENIEKDKKDLKK